MKLAFSFLLLVLISSQNTLVGQEKLSGPDDVVCTIVYDNSAINDSLIADHGFSCLLESGGHSTLFDAGRVADKFMKNASQLGVNYSRIDQVVISHIHDDHMGGLFAALAKCDKPLLYLPFSYPQSASEPHTEKSDADFQALLEQLKPLVSRVVLKKEPGNIGNRFYTTGMIEQQTYEQALIAPTPKGLIIVTGCAHPGILATIRRAKELLSQDIYLVLGGFHLVATDSTQVKTIARELRTLTKTVGPCHCTGKKALAIFREVFKEDCIDVHTGLRLKVASADGSGRKK